MELDVRNSSVPKNVRATKRKTVVLYVRMLSVRNTQLTRSTAEQVRICPTLARISVVKLVSSSAIVLITFIRRRILGATRNRLRAWVTRQIFVAITAVVRTSVEIGAGFVTVLVSYARNGNRVDPLIVLFSSTSAVYTSTPPLLVKRVGVSLITLWKPRAFSLPQRTNSVKVRKMLFIWAMMNVPTVVVLPPGLAQQKLTSRQEYRFMFL